MRRIDSSYGDTQDDLADGKERFPEEKQNKIGMGGLMWCHLVPCIAICNSVTMIYTNCVKEKLSDNT